MRPGQAGRDGFTTLEMTIVLIVVGILATLGASKYASMVTQARRSACIEAGGVIDRSVRNWEHRNRDLPAGASITFDLNGNVSATSGLGSGPVPSGPDIKNLASSEDLFVCPERITQLGGKPALTPAVRSAENDYTWLNSAAPDPRLNNNRTGTFCIFYVDTGPDQTAETKHR